MAKHCPKCGTGLFDGQFICPVCSNREHLKGWQRSVKGQLLSKGLRAVAAWFFFP